MLSGKKPLGFPIMHRLKDILPFCVLKANNFCTIIANKIGKVSFDGVWRKAKRLFNATLYKVQQSL